MVGQTDPFHARFEAWDLEAHVDIGSWSSIFSGVGLLISAASTAFLVVQIRRAKLTFETEQARLKRQSTLEFIATTMERVYDLGGAMPQSGDIPATMAFIEKARSSPETMRIFQVYFNYHESLAAGSNCGIFDIEVIYRVRGTTIIRMAELYHDFVEELRAASNHPERYREIDKLAKRLLEYEKGSGRPTSSLRDGASIAASTSGVTSERSAETAALGSNS
jgi:hypothetical protein